MGLRGELQPIRRGIFFLGMLCVLAASPAFALDCNQSYGILSGAKRFVAASVGVVTNPLQKFFTFLTQWTKFSRVPHPVVKPKDVIETLARTFPEIRELPPDVLAALAREDSPISPHRIADFHRWVREQETAFPKAERNWQSRFAEELQRLEWRFHEKGAFGLRTQEVEMLVALKLAQGIHGRRDQFREAARAAGEAPGAERDRKVRRALKTAQEAVYLAYRAPRDSSPVGEAELAEVVPFLRAALKDSDPVVAILAERTLREIEIFSGASGEGQSSALTPELLQQHLLSRAKMDPERKTGPVAAGTRPPERGTSGQELDHRIYDSLPYHGFNLAEKALEEDPNAPPSKSPARTAILFQKLFYRWEGDNLTHESTPEGMRLRQAYPEMFEKPAGTATTAFLDRIEASSSKLSSTEVTSLNNAMRTGAWEEQSRARQLYQRLHGQGLIDGPPFNYEDHPDVVSHFAWMTDTISSNALPRLLDTRWGWVNANDPPEVIRYGREYRHQLEEFRNLPLAVAAKMAERFPDASLVFMRGNYPVTVENAKLMMRFFSPLGGDLRDVALVRRNAAQGVRSLISDAGFHRSKGYEEGVPGLLAEVNRYLATEKDPFVKECLLESRLRLEHAMKYEPFGPGGKNPEQFLPRSTQRVHEVNGSVAMVGGKERPLDTKITSALAAEHVYRIPDLGVILSEVPYNLRGEARVEDGAKRLLESLDSFVEQSPSNLTLEAFGADDFHHGLKWAYYRPSMRDRPDAPSVVSIAGTRNPLDWLTNFGLGAIKRDSEMYRNLVHRVVDDMMSGRRVVITGHSLGGGMAQYLAWDVAKELRRMEREAPHMFFDGGTGTQKNHPDRVWRRLELNTFNAFGVKHVIEKEDPELAQRMGWKMEQATHHYRNHYDLVSLLGKPTGTTVQLPDTGGYWGLVDAHVMQNVLEGAVASRGIDSDTGGGTPLYKTANILTPRIRILPGWLIQFQHKRTAPEKRAVLEKAIEMAIERGTDLDRDKLLVLRSMLQPLLDEK